jgi:aminoglycoside phosphotransferase family enzyme/predicted kinase
MAPPSEQERIAAWLTRPETYPHRPSDVQQIQTHISRVFLAGEYVYKLKKAVRFDFLDFSTAERRERACREEVRLNRRLAPDTYVGTVPITKVAEGSYHLGGEGPAIDWLVQMRRLPTDRTLDVLLSRGELTRNNVHRLAETLVGFYRDQPALSIAPEAYRARIAEHVRGNRTELLSVRHCLPPGVVERVHNFQLQLLALEPSRFDARVRQGHVVEGHGDLRPEHICLTEPVTIFDCIEFSRDFREIDIADELAFLAAECDFLGGDWVGSEILQAYQQASGDWTEPVLLSFYKSYRACVRAKVAALRANQVEGDEHKRAADQARRRLELADGYARPWLQPLVVAVGGLSGTGKTTLATAVADALGAELLRTDLVRRELFGASEHAGRLDADMYSMESRLRIYDEIYLRAAAIHRDATSVVIDATFSNAPLLRRAGELVTHPCGRFLAVECVCRPEVARERISRRLTEGRDASDARPELHDAQRQRWDPWPEEIPQVRIDTEQPLAEQVDAVIAAL